MLKGKKGVYIKMLISFLAGVFTSVAVKPQLEKLAGRPLDILPKDKIE